MPKILINKYIKRGLLVGLIQIKYQIFILKFLIDRNDLMKIGTNQ